MTFPAWPNLTEAEWLTAAERYRKRHVQEHLGPGPHPSGSPQAVHGGKGGAGGSLGLSTPSKPLPKGFVVPLDEAAGDRVQGVYANAIHQALTGRPHGGAFADAVSYIESMAGEVKASVVKRLAAAAELPAVTVNRFIKAWAIGSNDSILSAVMQQEATGLFGGVATPFSQGVLDKALGKVEVKPGRMIDLSPLTRVLTPAQADAAVRQLEETGPFPLQKERYRLKEDFGRGPAWNDPLYADLKAAGSSNPNVVMGEIRKALGEAQPYGGEWGEKKIMALIDDPPARWDAASRAVAAKWAKDAIVAKRRIAELDGLIEAERVKLPGRFVDEILRPMARSVLTASYDESQRTMRESGLLDKDGYVTVYRGFTEGAPANNLHAKSRVLDRRSLRGPLEAWSLSPHTARLFGRTGGGMVVQLGPDAKAGYGYGYRPGGITAGRFHVSRIVGSALSGHGCLGEYEVVIGGDPKNDRLSEVRFLSPEDEGKHRELRIMEDAA